MNSQASGAFYRCAVIAGVIVLGLAFVCVAEQKKTEIGLETNGDAWQFYRTPPADPVLPRILLIGDSIVNGYRGTVCRELAGLASVDTWLTPLHLKSDKLHDDLKKVLTQGPYDVVHFNIGLHGWTPGRIPEGEYEPLLRAYVNVLSVHGGKAKLIWGSTTQITVRDHPTDLDPKHNPTIATRNIIAARVMGDMGVEVDDLYGLMSDKLNLASGDKYHWKTEARKLQGRQVAVFVKEALEGDLPQTAGASAEHPPVAKRTQVPEWPEPVAVLYVSPDGSDAAPGTQAQPLATLEGARDALRTLKQEGKLAQGGATVYVRGGTYRVTQPFALTSEDSGEASAPIRYRAVEGETPVFSGGIRLEGLEPVRDAAVMARLPEDARDKVVQVDLARYGVSGLKPLRLGGFNSGLGFQTHPVMELFFDGEAMPLSRWPNDGFVRVAGVSIKDGHTIHGREGSKIGRLLYDGERPKRWGGEQAMMLYGYWFFDWADSYERVASIDTAKREIVLEEPYCGYGYRPGAPYYAVNLLCEIDMPGEWYLDRVKGVLYFYPPSNPSAARVELSVANYPFVEFEDVSYTALQGFVWELGGVDAVVIRGGSQCLVAECTVRRCGGNGVVVEGGNSHSLLGCSVYSMGRGGVVVSGGDRKTLTPGKHLVENCDIHQLSRIDHTYTPAVLLTGVGNRIARNRLHDVLSSAIRLGGNDHVVELNEIHHVVQESDDQGGADMWGNATFRGNIFRYNYWHHIGNQTNPHEEPGCGQAAIRLDDKISGTRVYGNVFHRSSAGKLGFGAVQIHGGKDNVIENNVFVECMAALSLTAWGDARWCQSITGSMSAPEIDPALYVKRYPELERLAEDHDVNHISRNLVLNCEEFLRRDSGRTDTENNVVMNVDAETILSADQDMDLHALTPLMKQNGLAPIPFDEIGLCGGGL